MTLFDQSLQSVVAEAVRESLKRAEFFATGRVVKVDTTASPHVYTVSSGAAERTMPMMLPATVGQTVVFMDLVSPLGLGPRQGD